MTETVIRKVDKGTELSVQLIDFVRKFSWDEVRAHTLHVLENWEFTDWETPFAALSEGRIIGMVTVMKTDYYPLPEIYPWISTLFVSEKFRGKRISYRLIEAAEEYARASGFEKTYIPTEFVGLYEKYGYSYVRDIVNYGGDVDRLYSKEI